MLITCFCLGSFFVLKNYYWHIFADTIIVGLLIKKTVCSHALCYAKMLGSCMQLKSCLHVVRMLNLRRTLRGARLNDRAFKTVVVSSIWNQAREAAKPPITNSLLCRFRSVRMGSFAVI